MDFLLRDGTSKVMNFLLTMKDFHTKTDLYPKYCVSYL